MDRVAAIARSWWPVPAIVLGAIAVQLVLGAGRNPVGHAADHLNSASVVFPMVALLAIIMWASPVARRDPFAWAAAGVMAVGLVLVRVANLRVVDAIGSADWTDEQAERFAGQNPDFVSGHELAEVASLVALVGAFLLIVVLMVRRVLAPPVGIASLVLTVVCPPWVIPGFGLFVATVAICVDRARRAGPIAAASGHAADPTPP